MKVSFKIDWLSRV